MKRGFTLIELLISLAIVGFISGVALVNFRLGLKSTELRLAAEEVVAQIQKTQAMTLGGRMVKLCFGAKEGTVCQDDNDCFPGSCQAQIPRGGYGVHFDKGNQSYFFFAESKTDEENKLNYQFSPGEKLAEEEISLPKNIKIEELQTQDLTREEVEPSSFLDIVFEPPKGRLYLNGEPRKKAQIILKHVSSGMTKKIVIDGITGLIEVE
jgi:prepilin-type N-terminal cleavage/methylation domain-containing protein